VAPADPREVIRGVYEAWNARDLHTAEALYHPDAVYDCSDRILNPDVYRGHDELRRFAREVDESWASFEVFLDEVVPVDSERFIALLHTRARGRASGVEVQESLAATLWTIRDGQAVHAKLFRDRRDAFAEAGIPDPSAE
jgi:ketosteroid isomerase-like protein